MAYAILHEYDASSNTPSFGLVTAGGVAGAFGIGAVVSDGPAVVFWGVLMSYAVMLVLGNYYTNRLKEHLRS